MTGSVRGRDPLPNGWAFVTDAEKSDGWAHIHQSDGVMWIHSWDVGCNASKTPGGVPVRMIIDFTEMPQPVPDLPDPGIPEARGGPSLRVRFAQWRVRRWDEKVAEARAAFQASIDAGQQDYWWERQLTIALGKRALWGHRAGVWK